MMPFHQEKRHVAPLARFARFCRTFTCPPILSSARSSAVGVKARLSLESLDARVLPAVYNWTGMVSSDATLLANWAMVGGPTNVIPGGDDTIVFSYNDPKLGWNPNCDGLVSGGEVNGLSFAEMVLQGNYNGTVTFGSALTTGAYTHDGGAISQPVPGTDLTVAGSFVWTGGILNSSSNLANVNLEGATGLFAPANGGTVLTGNNINLGSDTVATIKEGIITLANSATVNLNANSKMLVDPDALKIATFKVDVVGVAQINLKTGAELQVLSGQFGKVGNGIPLKNTGGTFILEDDTRGIFEGSVDNIPGEYCFVQTAGATRLATDAALLTEVKMTGGLFSVKAGTLPENFAGHIVGDFAVTGGSVRIESPEGDSRMFGTFRVSETVEWSGGTFYTYVDAEQDGGSSDVWQSTLSFAISGTASVVVTAVDGENNVVTPAANMSWYAIRSEVDITAANGTPSLSSG